ncbi:hypothetical protein HOT49_gp336 [Erwinia phage vB_EamM_Alexandra]|uniref:Uncharacterized protein n=1 Tax=Erwinia phage vB_EamM_Alexandra TaxID=2201424 RepID=A0A2Z4QEW9_9CAUD|nr:hypothetical protein HOT49_gp336 [Erwinia phage vB_EamM_Alexandra]AWY08589.1 hypothetical protein Alexandra_340 [Erwinia phage vB_EamM_Alexandra]
MSAEHLLNDDLPDDTLPLKVPTPQEKPSYFDLVSLRIEAAARLARSLKTLKDANVFGDDNTVNSDLMLTKALEVAEQHWASICNGVVPIKDSHGRESMRDNLPACIEAFRIIVMEHAQRQALELECRNAIDHKGGFKILTRTQLLYIEPKHVCDGTCDHDSKTV